MPRNVPTSAAPIRWAAAQWLRRSIASETALGLAAVVAAGQLATMCPAIHMMP